jgi:flagellum-specific ATP synthase
MSAPRLATADRLDAARAGLHALRPFEIVGRVSGIAGLALELEGTTGHLSIGDRVWITARDGQNIQAETVGFHNGLTRAMTFGALDGIGPGAPVVVRRTPRPAHASARGSTSASRR